MKDEILSHIENARELERLYRSNQVRFKLDFSSLYPQLRGHPLAEFWNERLNYREEKQTFRRSEILLVIITCLVAGFLAKLPDLFSLDEEFYYPRNIGFILFPALTAYFAWKNQLPGGKAAILIGATIVSVVFINALPQGNNSDTLVLSCIHLVLFLWAILGFAFVGEAKNHPRRLEYLRYNGDLVVMTTLIVIAGGILSGITIGLFSLIGFNIQEFYFRNIVVFGLPAAPIVGTYLTQTNPQLVGKISPVIAKIFSPLVLVMLVIYLGAMMYSGKNPYTDREFLLIFNVLLIGVLALIFFSVAGSSSEKSKAEIWILLLLSVAAVIVNGVALSAILFRIAGWGFTPNRTAVLGSNLLILVNTLLVAAQLFRSLSGQGDTSGVGKLISTYLPVYVVWVAIVTFLFPVLFGFQ